ncbi:hypothetical protein A8924_3447 [Saccharopolyspora erythraea NRRL 2338]|uniref:Uncharacterized protein n=1 Tax=Saccharopolyspora erythraea TaxID=1836 RepID=A0ABP3MKP4_SACER|nr:hypothetical protein [Saccharopolyspora erythraea]EQD82018.1 hypothetical protein N599_32950 [Saccharopolyspora erythraea D]PFG96059.1 hypothetical protein A8924_3447 [Saccharopolyspora erythraea NRRL 2338]QRK92605.1 hypothetical protein JQX30_15685 [Saccharopolyspora erythraea]
MPLSSEPSDESRSEERELLLSFRNKPVLFTPDEVRAHQESVRHLP